jgi:hypothetical protein
MTWSAFFHTRRQIAMHAKNMVGNDPVALFVHVVCDDEEEIKTRQQ